MLVTGPLQLDAADLSHRYVWGAAVDHLFGYTGKLTDPATGLQNGMMQRWAVGPAKTRLGLRQVMRIFLGMWGMVRPTMLILAGWWLRPYGMV